MLVGQAIPGAFLCFAAAVLLIFVCINRFSVVRAYMFFETGFRFVADMGENLVP